MLELTKIQLTNLKKKLIIIKNQMQLEIEMVTKGKKEKRKKEAEVIRVLFQLRKYQFYSH